MKKNRKQNIRVVVYPRSPGDFGSFSISGQKRSEEETLQMCEEIADDIRRHVDNIPSRSIGGNSRGVSVEWDDDPVCEYCGSIWSEDSVTYNGGCCSKDEENNPETAA